MFAYLDVSCVATPNTIISIVSAASCVCAIIISLIIIFIIIKKRKLCIMTNHCNIKIFKVPSKQRYVCSCTMINIIMNTSFCYRTRDEYQVCICTLVYLPLH